MNKRKKMKKRRIQIEFNVQLSIVLVFFLTLFSCQEVNSNKKKVENITSNGSGCGTINPNYGNIRIIVQKDSLSYLLIILKEKLTSLESGEITLQPMDTLSKVFLLDFNTEEKKYDYFGETTKGYVYPCSDIITDSHVPDSLALTSGKLNINIETIVSNKKRIYFLDLIDAKFTKNNKVISVGNYKANIDFSK
jgi:hypothetical protein